MNSPKLVSADFFSGYPIRLAFADGTKGDVDFSAHLNAEGKPREYYSSLQWRTDFAPVRAAIMPLSHGLL